VDPGIRSPLIDFFRRGEVARDVRLLAAEGALAPRAHEQVALLVLLSGDSDPEIASTAEKTLARLPEAPLRAFLARTDVSGEIRRFFAGRGIEPAEVAAGDEVLEPLLDTLTELPQGSAGDATEESEPKLLSSLPVIERMKLAIKGSREQRAALIRDANRMVAAAVLSSPKVTDAEVEAFTRMGNVAEETLRAIGMNRSWTKHYGVVVGLCRNPKTPPGISLTLIHRVNERDLKMLAIDRNVPEPIRLAARKIVTKGKLD
jgi:hypothetical protein